MRDLRTNIDTIEMIVPKDMWPVPTYADLLFKL
jgi:glutamine synthetase